MTPKVQLIIVLIILGIIIFIIIRKIFSRKKNTSSACCGCTLADTCRRKPDEKNQTCRTDRE